LARMVRYRLDRRLRARLDATDVVQDAIVEATRRLPDYLRAPRLPPFVWLRLITREHLTAVHRRHLGAEKRDAGRERAGTPAAAPASEEIALEVSSGLPGPVSAVLRREAKELVERTLDSMDAIDREVLVLRHFEGLSNEDVAGELDIEPAAASKRYLRALERLSGAVEKVLGESGGPRR